MTKKINRIDLLKIKDPSFLQALNKKELKQLAIDIREFIINNLSKTGGHLSSNLGVVELTIALHYVFNNETDKIIFDVGHQSYTHKILTGRASKFNTLRKTNGLSGYINYNESKYDVWESGHSSTSISALEGFLYAKDNNENIGDCVCLIGDSSIASGVAFEALNHLGSKTEGSVPFIILNDNKMGISKSVGSLNKRFAALRRNRFLRGIKSVLRKITITPIRNFCHKIIKGIKSFMQNDNIFESLGYDYFGPIDGNNISLLIKEINRVKKFKKPAVLHVITKKGKGYEPAENDIHGLYHSIGPFDIKTGKPISNKVENEYSYTEVVMDTLYKLREENKFMIIDPAMVLGNEIERFTSKFKNCVIDVGIAEEHAASFASSLSLNNQKPIILYYSTFIQRAYDEILNDIARQNRNVILGIDRCGIVGADGQTHQGIYDISMLSGMPNMKICMGSNAKELRQLFKYAINNNSPIAIRYIKGNDFINLDTPIEDVDESWIKSYDGDKAIVISYGPDITRIKNIVIDNKLSVMIINARFIKPIDTKMLDYIASLNLPILIYEQVVESGSLYQKILSYYNNKNINLKIKGMNIKDDTLISHGDINELLNIHNLGDKDIYNTIMEIYEN